MPELNMYEVVDLTNSSEDEDDEAGPARFPSDFAVVRGQVLSARVREALGDALGEASFNEAHSRGHHYYITDDLRDDIKQAVSACAMQAIGLPQSAHQWRKCMAIVYGSGGGFTPHRDRTKLDKTSSAPSDAPGG
eukprot:2811938-Pyramimonas_sp.AAC.1